MRLRDTVAIVTGAGRGLGEAVALRFAREGARLVLCGRHAPAVERVAQQIRRAKGDAVAIKADVSLEHDVDRLAKTALKTFGRIDALVNNAGVLTPKGPLQHVRAAEWDAVMAANVRGPFLCMRAALPAMLAQRSGSIMTVSSGAGKREAPLWGPYAVSKFAVEGLTLVAAGETRGAGVRVNAVNPGALRTAMRAAAYPQEDPMTLPLPEAVTGLFVYLASEASQGVTGQSLDAPAWLSEHPEWR